MLYLVLRQTVNILDKVKVGLWGLRRRIKVCFSFDAVDDLVRYLGIWLIFHAIIYVKM